MACLLYLISALVSIITTTAARNSGSYSQMRQNVVNMLEASKYLNVTTLKKVEENLQRVLDMEKVLSPLTPVNKRFTENDSFAVPLADPTPFPIPDVSAQCLVDGQSVLAALQKSQEWALHMVDAMAKPPSGILEGDFTWPGDYDECLEAKNDMIQGKYCQGKLWVNAIKNPITQTQGGTLQAGLCVPTSCSNNDILKLLTAVVPKISNNTAYPYEVTCKDPDQSYDTRAIIVLVIITNFILIMTIATIYDVTTTELEKRRKNIPHGGIINIAYISNEKFEDIEDNTVKDEQAEPVNVLDKKEPQKRGIGERILLSFSVYTNSQKILGTHQGAGTLTAVNGIRFISMTWVILGHTFAFGMGQVDNIRIVAKKFISWKSFMAILNAEVSVDSFFALSGTLLTYLILQQLHKVSGFKNWLKYWGLFYFHRFWRLTPVYMLMIMVNVALFPYLGSGPFWTDPSNDHNSCKTNWWYNLLYINNFVKESNECFGWGWYLANDMQFYVISPIIILSLYHSKIAGSIVMVLFWIGTTTAAGVVSKHYELGVNQGRGNGDDYFNQYYQRPYCRMGPYLVGMYCGFLLYKTKCKFNIKWYLNLLLWAVFGVIASTALYIVYRDFNGHAFSVSDAAAFNALHRSAWGLGVCWVIFACATGNGGIINTILSWKPFIPLGRLTYCAYLVHPLIIFYYFGSRKKLLHWDIHEIIYEYLGNLVLAYGCAFVASLAFEAPMMGMEKVIFKRDEKKA